MQLHLSDYINRGSKRFTRLGTWYILALSIIATVAILGQILIQSHLKTQLADSRVVNVAGKQRMLSQKITKTVLLLRDGQSPEERQRILHELRASVHLWRVSQDGLLHGNDSLKLPGANSTQVRSLFEDVQGPLQEWQREHRASLRSWKECPPCRTVSLKMT